MITQPGKKAAIYRASKHMRLPSPVFCVALSTDPTLQDEDMLHTHAVLSREFPKWSMHLVGASSKRPAPGHKGGSCQKGMTKRKGEKGEESWGLSYIRQKALHHSAAITASSICDSSAWPILNCDLLKYTSTWILCYIWGPQFYHIVFKKTWLFCRLFAFSLACSPSRTLQLWQKKKSKAQNFLVGLWTNDPFF